MSLETEYVLVRPNFIWVGNALFTLFIKFELVVPLDTRGMLRYKIQTFSSDKMWYKCLKNNNENRPRFENTLFPLYRQFQSALYSLPYCRWQSTLISTKVIWQTYFTVPTQFFSNSYVRLCCIELRLTECIIIYSYSMKIIQFCLFYWFSCVGEPEIFCFL